MKSRSLWFIAVSVILALTAWPFLIAQRASQIHAEALPTMAPVTPDYLYRNQQIAFWESAVRRKNRGDVLSPRMLSAQYLQRYRETGDVDDVLRAERMARRSLAVDPIANVGAETALASALITLHRFREARVHIARALSVHRGDPSLLAREAGVDLELGAFESARALLAQIPAADRHDTEPETVEARFDEITGHLADARRHIAHPMAMLDDVHDAPAQARAWYHFRTGEMAFEAGDVPEALAQEKIALDLFPTYADALRARARFECATHAWQDALHDAERSAAIVPYPETLGYEADAQRGLGDTSAARRTDDLIRAVERIGNAQHLSDRLLAIYYSEHRIHTADALHIARDELAVRDDIFAEDTLAWAAAMDERWDEAKRAIAKATRYHTEDARMQYHAGIIALHFGDRSDAKTFLERALSLNPYFHPTYADDARRELARL